MDTAAFVTSVWHLTLHIAVVLTLTAALLALLRVRVARLRLAILCGALTYAVGLPLLRLTLWWPLAGAGDREGAFASAVLAASTAALSSGRSLLGGLSWADLVAPVVVGGALLRMAWLVAGAVRLRSGAGRMDVPPAVADELARCQTEIGTRAAIEWRRGLASAATVGLFPPRVLLPESLAAAAPATRRAVVCHELLHVRRGDWGYVLVEEALRTLLWFHPGVHWAVAEIRLAREQIVDREVVRLTGARRSYLELLLSYGDAHETRVPGVAVPFFGRRQIERRIHHLTMEATMTRGRTAMALLVTMLVTGVTGSVVTAAFPVASGPAVNRGSGETATGEKTLPRVIHQVAALYPEDAKAARVEGTVVVSVTVGTEGHVIGTRVIESIPMLDAAAEDALKQWRFEPGREDGKAVKVDVSISVRFSLK